MERATPFFSSHVRWGEHGRPVQGRGELRRAIFAENLADTRGNLTHGGAALDGLEDRRHYVSRGAGLLLDPIDRRLPAEGIPAGAQGANSLDLNPLHGVLDIAERHFLARAGEAVYAHYDDFPGIHGLLVPVGSVFNVPLHPASFDGSYHAAQGVDTVEIAARLLLHGCGERFDVEGTAKRINRVSNPDSLARICCVRRARRADSSLGRASASS